MRTSWLPLPRMPAVSHVSTISNSPRGTMKEFSAPSPVASSTTTGDITKFQVALWQPLANEPW